MKFDKMKLENKYQQAVYSLYINMINMVYIFPFYMLSYWCYYKWVILYHLFLKYDIQYMKKH